MGTNTSYEAQKPHYDVMWGRMKVLPSWDQKARAAAKTANQHKAVYQAAVQGTPVPWYIVAVIHMRESSFNFKTHLHNGDPLTARTVRVPAGRPKSGKPPFSWQFSAQDAIRYDGLDTIEEWPIARMCYELECYNGKGYMFKGKPSPYLWSGTDQYKSGKYVADGQYDPAAVDKQLGCMTVLRYLLEGEMVEAKSPKVKVPKKPELGDIWDAIKRWWYG